MGSNSEGNLGGGVSLERCPVGCSHRSYGIAEMRVLQAERAAGEGGGSGWGFVVRLDRGLEHLGWVVRTVPWRCQEPRRCEIRCVTFEKSGAILSRNPDTWWGLVPSGHWVRVSPSPVGQDPRRSLACPGFIAPRWRGLSFMGQGILLGRCWGKN